MSLRKIKKLLISFIGLFKSKKIVPIYIKADDKLILKNKVAIITGGSGGIGLAIAKRFIDSGCKVIICGTNEDKLKKICKDIGNNIKYLVLDLYKVNEFDKKLDKAINMYGKIDILVNSAGMHVSRRNLDFTNVTEEEYNSIMNLNLKGMYFFTQKFAQYLIKNKISGNILMISSQSALEPSWSPYRISKKCMESITKGLAQTLIRYGIIVNGIGPGPTATKMQGFDTNDTLYTEQNPIKRYTTPEEIAEFALMLVSEYGKTIVGDTIYMSGGRGIIDLR